MTKTELMETYTAEQLADKYLRLQERFNRYTEVIKGVVDELPEELKQGTEFHLEIDRLQSEVEEYRKAFEDAKNELEDLEIKIEEEYKPLEVEIENLRKNERELSEENAELHSKIERNGNISDILPTEPIKVAGMLINAEGEYEHSPIAKALCGEDKDTYNIFDISALRQIAEHLLVYCNHNGEAEE